MIVPITYELGEWMFRKYTSVTQIEDIGWVSSKKAYELFRGFVSSSDIQGLDTEWYIKKMSKVLNRVKVGKGKSVRYYYKDDEIIAYFQSILKNDDEILSNSVIETQLKIQGYISESLLKLNLNRMFRDNPQLSPEFINSKVIHIRNTTKSVCVGQKYEHWYYPINEVNSCSKIS